MFLKFSQPITQSRQPRNFQISLRVVEIDEGNLVTIYASPCHAGRPGAADIPRMVGHIGGSHTRHAKFFDRMVIRAGVGLVVTAISAEQARSTGIPSPFTALFRDWRSLLEKTDIWYLHMSFNL